MSYQATAYKVMIASPGDVDEERKIIRETINEWNYVNSDSRQIILIPVGWETHSSPEMGDRPQAILNKQILKDCDLLVGVFWTRIGTATGTHESGSVEEIEEHLKAGKQAMIYFSQTPVELDSVDNGQYQKLKAFKADCQSKGVYEIYSGSGNFKEKFSRQLQLKLNNDPYFKQEAFSFATHEEGSDATELNLSPEAQYLLKETSRSSDGQFIKRGTSIRVNGEMINIHDTPRDKARWNEAVSELIREGLTGSRSLTGSGHTVALNNAGFEVADTITNITQP